MAYVPLTSDEIRCHYSVSEQGEFLVFEGGGLYHTVLAKDKKTNVVPPGSNLTTLKTHARVVEKNLP